MRIGLVDSAGGKPFAAFSKEGSKQTLALVANNSVNGDVTSNFKSPVPPWLKDLINALVSVFSEVCQFFGGNEELCDWAGLALESAKNDSGTRIYRICD